jgi:hypothetical protein
MCVTLSFLIMDEGQFNIQFAVKPAFKVPLGKSNSVEHQAEENWKWCKF